jgi:hypothetical protein
MGGVGEAEAEPDAEARTGAGDEESEVADEVGIGSLWPAWGWHAAVAKKARAARLRAHIAEMARWYRQRRWTAGASIET